MTLSVMWLSFGPVCATCSAHSGAARQNSTIMTNKPPHASATRVAPQPKPRQIPGAAALDLRGRYAGRKRRLTEGLHLADRALTIYLSANAE